MLKWIKVLLHTPNSSKEMIGEGTNIVQSIANAKSLYKELIAKAHPDKNRSKEELVKFLTEEINNSRYNYCELLKLKQRVETEL